MKLIRDYATKSHALAFKDKLRKKGILSFIAPARAYGQAGFEAGYQPRRFRVGVWIALDEQFEDASNLVRGNRHVVESPLTEQEMEVLEVEFAKEVGKSKSNFYSIVMAAFVTFIVLFIGGALLI